MSGFWHLTLLQTDITKQVDAVLQVFILAGALNDTMEGADFLLLIYLYTVIHSVSGNVLGQPECIISCRSYWRVSG